jgi:hypothetical protein
MKQLSPRQAQQFVGRPVGAVHVAWNDGPDGSVNSQFVAEVRQLAAGTEHVFNVENGFEGLQSEQC